MDNNTENYLTLGGLKKLKKELNHLENIERKKLAEKLNYAISFGDLKENAAYYQAKEQQGFLEGRIAELKAIIGNARVANAQKSDKVQIGATVVLASGNNKEEYLIVGSDEADVFCGKISCRSPLGVALFGKTAGCEIILETPKGKIEYRILEIK